VRLLLEGRPFEVWEGHQLRDFNYVDDCVNALLLAAEREEANGQIFNLGDRNPVSLLELADLLIELHGSGSYSVHSFPTDRKKIDIGDYYSDFGKYESVVGWVPKVSLREGLARTLEYYRTNFHNYL
jgi:nucleoside-diphosphate-sugar epimerase